VLQGQTEPSGSSATRSGFLELGAQLIGRQRSPGVVAECLRSRHNLIAQPCFDCPIPLTKYPERISKHFAVGCVVADEGLVMQRFPV